MKRLFLGIIFLTVLAMQSSAFAAKLANPGTPARKLQRGFLNVALSPFEISHEVVKLKKADTALPNWSVGIIKGSFAAVGRALVGTYEMLTSPFAIPANYEPLLKPEFAWEYLEKNS